MPEWIVVGLYGGRGTAEDARNRLKTEGFAESDLQLRTLREVGPMPQTMAAETADFAIDLFYSNTLPREELTLIHNGETVVSARTRSAEDARAAILTLRQYAPLEIRILEAPAAGGPWREVEQPGTVATP
jgi:hypothetical protein